jgi:hypothetical protein
MEPTQPPGLATGHARTKLDLLYHDVLGEVAGLVDRLETISQNLNTAQQQTQAAADAQQVLPQQLARQLAATLEATAKPIHQQHEQAIQAMLDGARTQLDHHTQQSAQTAKVIQRAARRMTLIAIALGGVAGVPGGLLAGLVLGQWLIS